MNDLTRRLFRAATARWVALGSATILATFSTSGVAGCERPKSDSPVEVYTAFSRAVQKGDYKAAYAALSEETKRLLQEHAKEISQASGGAIKNDPAALAFSGSGGAQPPAEVKLESQEGSRATLSATGRGEGQRLQMVRDAGGWKVDLTEAFRTPRARGP